jgi:pyruvate dehydrogenase E2 component (dihydrolipoamide acetyltransferase)
VAEGEVVQWFVEEGGTVQEDAPLVSVLTDKANVEIPSPKSGRILRIHAKVGEKVKVGGILVTIDEGSGASTSAPSPPSTKLGSGEPARGASAPAAAPAAAPAPMEGAGRVLATPRIRKIAAERGIDLSRLRGTGPGGRIQESDLEQPVAAVAAPSMAAPAAGAKPAPPRPVEAPSAASGEFQAIPIRGIRRTIAERMATSVHTAAHFTYVEEVEVSELVRLRERMSKHTEKSGAKLSYLPFIVKAVIQGLRAHPWMNARMDDARGEIQVYDSYHIGIATATDDGLIVPVIHHAERLSLNQLAKEIQSLSDRGREGKLSRAELTGGTFTITSLGLLGGLLATPILNYPEVAILGVHKIQRRPTYLADGSIGPGQFMNLSVSLDHRVIDGIVGAQFLAVVKAHLEEPHSLFSDSV